MTVGCAFAGCEAQLEPVREMRYPGPSAGSVTRIPQHDIEGANAWYGPCPGSLMTRPLNEDMRRTLAEAGRRLSAARNRQRSGEPDPVTGTARPTPHSRAPHPDPDPRWFRNSQAPDEQAQQERHERQNELGIPDELAARRGQQVTTTQGGSVTSVADVKASIDDAVHTIQEAISAQGAMAEKVNEAMGKVAHIQQASADQLGLPVLASVNEDAELLGRALAHAVEVLEHYKVTL